MATVPSATPSESTPSAKPGKSNKSGGDGGGGSGKKSTENKVIKGLQVRHEPDPTVDPDEYRFDREIILQMMDEPFLGTVGLAVVKVPDWKCDTAYVGVNRDSQGLVMGYNPDFMRGLPTNQRQGVFKHELYHVLFMHVTGRSMADRRRFRLWNVATDLAINSLICEKRRDHLPDFCLLPGEAPKYCEDKALGELIKSFPMGESADWYMEKLEEYAQQNGKKNSEGEYVLSIGGPDGETFDQHGAWGDVPEELRDIIREQINQAIDEGIKNVQRSTHWGSVPQSFQAYIEALRKHEVDWRSVVRMFAGRCRSMKRSSTIKRINKKFPYKFPGVKRETVARLLWAIDQSGSMSDEDVQLGLAEGFACSYEAEMDIVNFDTEIDEKSFRSVRKGQNFKWERTRCGGTDFNCVMRFVNSPKNRGKWTGVVLMTDGYADNLGRIVGAKVLWLITPQGTMERVRTGDLAVQMKKDKKVKKK